MRRIVIVVTLATLSSVIGMATASAAGCPSEASGFVPYQIHGSAGDPAPAPGFEPLWDLLVVGAAQEGLTLSELAASIGLDVDGLYNFVLGGWFRIDMNSDRTVCVKPFSAESQGKPAYIFNFIDNNAQAT